MSVYKVFYDNNTLIFSGSRTRGDALYMTPRQLALTDLTKIPKIFRNSDTVEIISPDFEDVFRSFCGRFVATYAAGGVVTDPAGRVLMMQRRGRWDLPKGHREAGETDMECARREVCEECGIADVDILHPICRTLHFYNTYGPWELKHTEWFAIRYAGSAAPVPQCEEDITALEWCDTATALDHARSSFTSILEVLSSYEKTINPKI